MKEKILLEETRLVTKFTAFATDIDAASPGFKVGESAGMVPAYLTYDQNGIAQDIVKFSGNTIFHRTKKNTFVPIESAGINYATGYTWSTELPNQLKNTEGISDKYYNKFHKVASLLSSGKSQTHVVREDIPVQDYIVNVGLEKSFDALDTLSVYNSLEKGLPYQESDTGVVFGRLIANQKIKDKNGNTVKVPLANVPIGVFLPSEEFPTSTATDENGNRIQLNFLNTESEVPFEFDYHVNLEGDTRFPREPGDLDSPSADFDSNILLDSSEFENIPEHYKIVSRTNQNGEFVLYNVPVGTQVLYFEVDLLKQGMTKEEVALNFFPYKTVSNPNVDSIPHLFFRQFPIEVLPAWGGIQTGYTETNINVNLDLRKWNTYYFPPISYGGPDFEEMQNSASPRASVLNIQIRDMTAPDFNTIPVSLVEIQDPLERNQTQQLEWSNEFLQSKDTAEFRRDDFSILKLPSNIYSPRSVSTSELNKQDVADRSGFDYTPKAGNWFAGYQFKVTTNLSETWFRVTGFEKRPQPLPARSFSSPANLDIAHINRIRRMRPDVRARWPEVRGTSLIDRARSLSNNNGVAIWYFQFGLNELSAEQLDTIARQPVVADIIGRQSAIQYIRRERPDVDAEFNSDLDVAKWYVDYGILELSDNQLATIESSLSASRAIIRDHYHVNRNVGGTTPTNEVEPGVGTFPYERPWDDLYPYPVRVPGPPRFRNPNWRGWAMDGSADPTPYVPEYIDGDIVGRHAAEFDSGGWGLQFQTNTSPWRIFSNRFSQRVTSGYLFKYEGGGSTQESYSNGYRPAEDVNQTSSVENGEKAQRLEGGYGYFMRLEGWPDAVLNGFRDYVRTSVSYGTSIVRYGATVQDDLDITVEAGPETLQQGSIEIFRVLNPSPLNLTDPNPKVTPTFAVVNTDRIFRRRESKNNRMKLGYVKNSYEGINDICYFFPHISDERLFTQFTLEIKNQGSASVDNPLAEGATLGPQESFAYVVALTQTTTEGTTEFQFQSIGGGNRLKNIELKLPGNSDFDPASFSFTKAKYKLTFKGYAGQGKDSGFSKSSHSIDIDSGASEDNFPTLWLNQSIGEVTTNINTGKNRSCKDDWKSKRDVYINGIIMAAGNGKENGGGLFFTSSRQTFSCNEDKTIKSGKKAAGNIGWRFR